MRSNPFEQIRDYYDVPAKRGCRVRLWTGEEATVISTYAHNLRVRLDDGYVAVVHPNYGVEYIGTGVRT